MDAKGVLTVCVNDPKTNTCVAPYHLTADKNPPKVDAGGFGLRVPGIVISPWAKKGTIDKQVMSHDAYLHFIEDLFLDGARIDPSTDGRRDSRPTVRENLQPGDLMNDFDFTQKPLPPLVLKP